MFFVPVLSLALLWPNLCFFTLYWHLLFSVTDLQLTFQTSALNIWQRHHFCSCSESSLTVWQDPVLTSLVLCFRFLLVPYDCNLFLYSSFMCHAIIIILFNCHFSSFLTIYLLFKWFFVAWQRGFPWKYAYCVSASNSVSFEPFCVWIMF